MCFISVREVSGEVSEGVPPTECTISLGIPSAQLNIFMALRELVDQSRTTPSREPDANKLAAHREHYMYIQGQEAQVALRKVLS